MLATKISRFIYYNSYYYLHEENIKNFNSVISEWGRYKLFQNKSLRCKMGVS